MLCTTLHGLYTCNLLPSRIKFMIYVAIYAKWHKHYAPRLDVHLAVHEYVIYPLIQACKMYVKLSPILCVYR